MSEPPVVVFIAPSAEATARRAAAALGGALHGRAGADVAIPDVPGAVAEHLRALFLAGRPVVGVMAAGILIRALAPVLARKGAEPPVVALAEDGSAAVPLLGGHRGANALAVRLADALGGQAAVTTAGDLSLGVALDAPPPGWRLERPADAKAAMAGLLAGRPARLSGRAGWLAPLATRPSVTVAPEPAEPVVLAVEGAEPLVWRRPRLALGVGCARSCPADELIGLARRALAEAGYAEAEVARVVSVDLKADEAAVHALAAALGVEARFFPPDRLERETPRLATPSATVFAEVGCHGVAEGAALAAAGPAATLAIAKRKTANATVAAAEIGEGGEPGRPRGRLAVVGLGPGAADWRTPEATRLVAEAEEIVGYGLYLDLLGPLATGKALRDFPLGAETERCAYALERAGEGARVALVCSGDPGIYAMAALVMELLDRGAVSPAARRAEIVIAPGISALQAAAARAGALLGHDFCAVSLSDLLTPRETILRRLRAAAEGDFVIALYNPVSARRRTLLGEAREILLAHRPPDTPALLARDLGRPGERLAARTLASLDTAEVDMLTVVLVGSSASRAARSGDGRAGAGGTWLYTPRGYAARTRTEAE